MIDIQAQALTLDQVAYTAFVDAAATQAHAANAFVTPLAGVSTKYGTR